MNMNDEKCSDHAQLLTDIAVIKRDLTENCRISQEILHSIIGNSKIGLLTQAELNRSAIRRAWWWLGGISFALLTSWILHALNCGGK